MEDKVFLKSELLKDMRNLRTKQQIWKLAQRMVDQTKQNEGHIRRIAQSVYDKQRAHLMASLNLERGGTEGGFFPQAGTNLTTPSSAIVKRAHSQKKSVEKHTQAQQKSPMLVSPEVMLVSPGIKQTSPGFKMPSPFNRVSPPK